MTTAKNVALTTAQVAVTGATIVALVPLAIVQFKLNAVCILAAAGAHAAVAVGDKALALATSARDYLESKKEKGEEECLAV